MTMSYTQVRQSTRIYRDGLRCRTDEIIKQLASLDFEDDALLDVGAADGAMLTEIRRAYPHAHYLGIDAHEPYVQAAQARREPVVVANAAAIPCRDGRFGVVTIVSTLKHIADHRAVLRECWRVLRPGGHLLLSDVSPTGITLGEIGGHFRKPPIMRRWSLDDAGRALSELGFEVLDRHHYMPLPVATPLDDWVMALMRRLGVASLCMQQLVAARKPVATAPDSIC